MNNNALHWLAGFLEGEGSFGCYISKSTHNEKDYKYKRPVVQFVSTDYDVANRACMILDTNCIELKIPAKGIKVPYKGSISGDKAINLMLLMYPLMGGRRKREIVKAIAFYKDVDELSVEKIITNSL